MYDIERAAAHGDLDRSDSDAILASNSSSLPTSQYIDNIDVRNGPEHH